ncbi:U6 snRNA-associated Sm-like protein LSm7 isoform X2 [Nannospalax galili]|uniref:U6 snRNA-associated Sm-like protein LSm7 isoform X2 n=1 Tax=Nannospalax galili TaxID=1026970 RepID=UPI00111C0AC0|nr:U6 snRNA-associated Sm-like protein LSm7 isoform X2 [Nannospalax galili]
MADKEKKKKESILDLSKYIDKTIRVKFQGGREASGILKGFDPLLNLVLDGTIEHMRAPVTVALELHAVPIRCPAPPTRASHSPHLPPLDGYRTLMTSTS